MRLRVRVTVPTHTVNAAEHAGESSDDRDPDKSALTPSLPLAPQTKSDAAERRHWLTDLGDERNLRNNPRSHPMRNGPLETAKLAGSASTSPPPTQLSTF